MPKTKFESVIFTAITAWIRLHKSVYPKLSCHNGTAHTVISCRSDRNSAVQADLPPHQEYRRGKSQR